ncbi:hypothetical protein J3R30DRAFT_3515364 [Lentinula aciculospora]|uniref:J domain-containing protein n=1 Tax=Lentinula aciculospora TaxID=153920 RepID=A0A9W9A5A6_9AGAR|nr:hypothetical protein J3R30DRAFT_3515364 [Lentinula aciculospora]
MRIPSLFIFSSLVLLSASVFADSSAGGLYPPGLLPLINRANALLSTGQFNDAARVYTEAIEQSPADYLLYYKRATAYFSLSRHTAALEDFEKVLSLTSHTFDNAHLMKARIYAKEGEFELVRSSLESYTSSLSSQGRTVDSTAPELLRSVDEAEKLLAKARKEKKAQLWTACAESCSSIIRDTASHSIEVRIMRAECQLAAGDVEGSVGDLTRLAVLLPPSASMELQVRIWRLSYFLLSPTHGEDGSTSAAALAPLKSCLHYDPDSKICLPLHRLAKALEKSFAKVEEALQKEDWRGAVNLLTESGKGKEKDLWGRYEQAMKEHTTREHLLGKDAHESASKLKEPPIPLPDPFTHSPRRQILLRALCKSYTAIGTVTALRNADKWCSMLLEMDGCSEDVDAFMGRAEYLLSTEDDVDSSGASSSGDGNWDEAIRLLEKAFEASGRSNRDIHSKLNQTKKKVKQRRRKDYYKVLGVDRSADERTIKKAFRRAAKSAHPDKGGSEAKMAAVNEAYEVLTDPELRARFDAGDDPNDPSGGGGHPFPGGGGNPFAQYFQHSGGGFPGGGAYGPGQGGFKFQWSN